MTATGPTPISNVGVSVAQSAVITSANNGINVSTAGSGAITINNAGTINAGNIGISAFSFQGPITITSQASGQITAPVGIAAVSNTGAVNVTNLGAISNATVGVTAQSVGAVNVVNGANGQITFGKYGVFAFGGVTPTGLVPTRVATNGTLTLTNAGTISQDTLLPSQFAGAPAGTAALYGRTAGGNLTVTNAGTITGTTGIDAAILNLQPPGVAIGTLSITNAGTITATGGAAIDTSQSAAGAQITNSGTINGFVTLNAGSRFTNAPGGAFSATSTSTFGGGSLDNTGTVALASANLANLSSFNNNAGGSLIASGNSTISTQQGFVNAGTINLQNGRAGDRLTITGNYAGQNGQVSLDTATQTGTVDQLVITGIASGNTRLNLLNLTIPAAPFTILSPLVTAQQVNAGAFTLGNVQGFGTLDFALVNGQAAQGEGTTVSLATVPNTIGLSPPIALAAARTIAFTGATAILDRVTQLREEKRQAQSTQPGVPQMLQYTGMNQYSALISKDPIAPNLVQPSPAPVSNVRPAVFARAYGDFANRFGSGSVNFAGAAFARDFGYNQATGGLIAGSDVVISGLTSADDGLILGGFGGYTVASVDLNRSAGSQFYEGGTVGTYGTYLNGGFFADALFKVDLLGLDIRAPGVRQSTGLQNYNVLGNIGYRIPLPNSLYIEPTAGLEYVATNFNSNPALTLNTVPLRDGDTFRGRIGARLGTEFVENNIRVEPSITALVYEVFSQSGTGTPFFGGLATVTGLRDIANTRGEVQASINFFNLATGWSGFLRADYRVGNDFVGAGGRAGIRYQW